MISLRYRTVKHASPFVGPLAARGYGEGMSADGRSASDATIRFSTRVADYVAHRPGYPTDLYRVLRERMPAGAVADVGSGTGIFCAPMVRAGLTVYAVEPNGPMREAAERELSGFTNFKSVAGTAEATTLPDACVDLVTAAQAFHWFDPPRAAREFRRILRPGGGVALVWNTRKTSGSPFLEAYERLLNEFGTDYAAVRHDRADAERITAFFSPGFDRTSFPTFQRLDREGLRGRLLSSSYTPGSDDPRRGPMLDALDGLFDRFKKEDGHVSIEYETVLFCGSVAG